MKLGKRLGLENKKDMIRLKLIGIGIALLAIIMLACSCAANVETQSKDFDIKRVHYNGYGIAIYEVTTPKGSVYVARYGQGLCNLN